MSHNICFETICVENRRIRNLAYHQARIDKTRRDLWRCTDELSLAALAIPDFVTHERHKLRVAYAVQIEEIKWELHVPRTIRSIRKVYSNEVDYGYKYNDRSSLTHLFEQRGDADDILIIKNGLVTDSFFCNVAFYDGVKWYTPTSNLLPGTQRACLVDSGVITLAEITEEQITDYMSVKLFNALIDWEHAPELEIGLIS